MFQLKAILFVNKHNHIIFPEKLKLSVTYVSCGPIFSVSISQKNYTRTYYDISNISHVGSEICLSMSWQLQKKWIVILSSDIPNEPV